MKRVVILIGNSRAWGRGLIRGIAKYSSLNGPWCFLKTPAFFESESRKRFIDDIKHFNPDGIIMREVVDTQEIIDLGKPVVVSPHKLKRFDKAACIVEDSKATGQMAAEHLLSKGLRNFAFCGYDNMFWSQERKDGFCDRIKRSGHIVSVYSQPKKKKDRIWENEKPFLRDWLVSLEKPVGLMCCIDERSDQVAEMCKVEGINVPAEIAIIGVDNDDMICELAMPPLTSIAFDAEGVGFQAAEMLDDLMNSLPPSGRNEVITLPAYVCQRQSTDLIATEDADVAEAISFIRSNTDKLICVEDVLCEVAMPRRTLERRFKKLLGNSIYQEIQNERMKRIERLLIQTNMNINQITRTLNFSSSNELTRFFTRQRKMSPTFFRKKYHMNLTTVPSEKM